MGHSESLSRVINEERIMRAVRFLGLVVVLNVIRYVVGAVTEPALILPGLFGAMESASSYFNTSFSRLD